MPWKAYNTVNGQVLGETFATGARPLDYQLDALGSVVGTIKANGALENTYRYAGYGQQVSKTGAGADPKFRWVGGWGYRMAGTTSYVRRRHLDITTARWLAIDPIWPDEAAYLYALDNPTTHFDLLGLFCTSLKPTPANCAYYKELCRQGYIFACNSYYACLNTGDSKEANCARCCLQMRLQRRIASGKKPTCSSWIDDHEKCFKKCGYSNPCTNPITLRILCNNLFDPGATIPLPFPPFEMSCADLLRIGCSWPTPYPGGGIRPPRTPWKCITDTGEVIDCMPNIIPWTFPCATDLPPNYIPTLEAMLKNCLEYTDPIGIR